MNFANLAVLVLTFLAPAAAVLLFALHGAQGRGLERKGTLLLFGFAALVAMVGIARIDQPVKMELLWPITLEPSGYFEFSLQPHWTRFVWILYTSALLLGFVAYDSPTALEGGRRNLRVLFLCGTFLASVTAFLCENILLSLMFAEMAAFMIHAFGMEAGGEAGELERSSYLKRACFIFLGLAVLLAMALTRQFSTGSVMLLGAVLYIFANVVSRHNPHDWGRLPLTLAQLGMGLFLLERVMQGDNSSVELWAPLSAVFAAGTVVLAVVSLLSPAILGASFWLGLSFLGYLLFLRFSSNRPGDPFWGIYEAVGLGAVFGMCTLFRFGERMDLFWKRALSFTLVAVFLGVVSGALPSVEVAAARFDSDTSVFKIAALGVLTFLVAAVAGKALALSFGKASQKAGTGTFAVIAPSLLVLLAQAGALLRWNDLNFESVGGGGLAAMLYDPRVLVAASAVAVGLLTGALVGANLRRRGHQAGRDIRMEQVFPGIDPSLVQWNDDFVRLPEEGIERASQWLRGWGARGSRFVDNFDRGVFGDRLFRGFSDSGAALSTLARHLHNGQARMYLFLGVLFTLLSSLLFLLEGK